MTPRHAWLAGLLVLALAPLAVQAADERPRTVNVSGSGEVAAEPDLAHVTLGVEARKPTMADARAEVARTVDRVLALTRDLRIDPKFVNATRVQVQPEYSWNEKDRKQVLLGYIVSRQVQVELRDLEQLGVVDHVHLVEEHHDVGHLHLARQQDVLAGLGHRAVSGRAHQDGAVHLGGTGDHVLDVVGVSRSVNVSVVSCSGFVLIVRKSNRNTSSFLFWS